MANEDDEGGRVLVRMYVASDSAPSAQARRQLAALCERFGWDLGGLVSDGRLAIVDATPDAELLAGSQRPRWRERPDAKWCASWDGRGPAGPPDRRTAPTVPDTEPNPADVKVFGPEAIEHGASLPALC